jgi:hypothetical protein
MRIVGEVWVYVGDKLVKHFPSLTIQSNRLHVSSIIDEDDLEGDFSTILISKVVKEKKENQVSIWRTMLNLILRR